MTYDVRLNIEKVRRRKLTTVKRVSGFKSLGSVCTTQRSIFVLGALIKNTCELDLFLEI